MFTAPIPRPRLYTHITPARLSAAPYRPRYADDDRWPAAFCHPSLRGLPERLFWEGPPDGPLAPVPAPRAVLAPDVFLCTAITLPVYGQPPIHAWGAHHFSQCQLGSRRPPSRISIRPSSLALAMQAASLNLVLPKLVGIFPGQRGSSGEARAARRAPADRAPVASVPWNRWRGRVRRSPVRGGWPEKCTVVRNRAGVAQRRLGCAHHRAQFHHRLVPRDRWCSPRRSRAFAATDKGSRHVRRYRHYRRRQHRTRRISSLGSMRFASAFGRAGRPARFGRP